MIQNLNTLLEMNQFCNFAKSNQGNNFDALHVRSDGETKKRKHIFLIEKNNIAFTESFVQRLREVLTERNYMIPDLIMEHFRTILDSPALFEQHIWENGIKYWYLADLFDPESREMINEINYKHASKISIICKDDNSRQTLPLAFCSVQHLMFKEDKTNHFWADICWNFDDCKRVYTSVQKDRNNVRITFTPLFSNNSNSKFVIANNANDNGVNASNVTNSEIKETVCKREMNGISDADNCTIRQIGGTCVKNTNDVSDTDNGEIREKNGSCKKKTIDTRPGKNYPNDRHCNVGVFNNVINMRYNTKSSSDDKISVFVYNDNNKIRKFLEENNCKVLYMRPGYNIFYCIIESLKEASLIVILDMGTYDGNVRYIKQINKERRQLPVVTFTKDHNFDFMAKYLKDVLDKMK